MSTVPETEPRRCGGAGPRRRDVSFDWAEEVAEVMTEMTFEIVFAGGAVLAIVEAFDGHASAVGRWHTTIRAERIDRPKLHGATARVQSLSLGLL